MSTYIMLLTLTPAGRELLLEDPERLLRAENEIQIPGSHCFGLYAVLGEYDFISLLEAPDNDVAARFSLELGVRGGAHVQTLPAVPMTLLGAVGTGPATQDEQVRVERAPGPSPSPSSGSVPASS